jgi:hypothetical protein
MKKNIYLFIASLFMIISCVEQEIPIPEIPIIETERVVLLEELTGVKCPNCPTGAAAAADILANFPGQVIVVAQHGDLLTEPLSESACDFRLDEAKDLEQFLEPYFGKPAATINRTQIEGQTEFSPSLPSLWASFVEDELNKPHVLDLTADVSYDVVSREITVDVAALPRTDLEGSYNVSIMLTEGEILDAQEDQGVIIEDYIHEHVLRAMLTPFDGSSFATSPTEGNIINGSFSGVIPAQIGGCDLDVNHMEVVVFVHRTDGSNKEVIQAFEEHVVE